MRRTTALRTLPFVALLAFVAASARAQSPKLGPTIRDRAVGAVGSSRVIVMANTSASLPLVPDVVRRIGGTVHRRLGIINSYVADVPNPALNALVRNPLIARIELDRPTSATMERTGPTIGSTSVRQVFGYDGTGVGVAIIDSGVTSWHDDLADAAGGQRVERFVDFVNDQTSAYDDYGHGTHVAGIIAGNGFDSSGARSGIAPNARVIVLKVLDHTGSGSISDVIAALDYVVAHRSDLNIRVVNLSVASGVYESYNSDPLALAARHAVEAGVVVVAAAGNFGRDASGHFVYGAVTAPGNAPWVLTVGASSHMGTIDRSDDTVASFSSHGPTAIDATAKPDILAPGVGIESLSDPSSTFYMTQAPYLLAGTIATTYLPYLSQSGTSMAAPVVAGTVALMLQANPLLTPSGIKAILQYTAELKSKYDPLTQGAGFVNAYGAVTLARYLAVPSGAYPWASEWSRRIIWGNHMISGGRIRSDANAFQSSVVWGAVATPDGQAISWGDLCDSADCSDDTSIGAWGITCTDATCGNGVWSSGWARNIVWGGRCGGADCTDAWNTNLFASASGDTVVWGTGGGDTVVWGTSMGDTVVWGTSSGGDTVVWGTSCTDCTPMIWGR
jgi:serine protease AprX